MATSFTYYAKYSNAAGLYLAVTIIDEESDVVPVYTAVTNGFTARTGFGFHSKSGIKCIV
jgi:hypothetical protein